MLTASLGGYAQGQDAHAFSALQDWYTRSSEVGFHASEDTIQGLNRYADLLASRGREAEARCAWNAVVTLAIDNVPPTPRSISDAAQALVHAAQSGEPSDVEQAQALLRRLESIPGYSPRTLAAQKADAWGALAYVRLNADDVSGAGEAIAAYDRMNPSGGAPSRGLLVAARALYAEANGDVRGAQDALERELAAAVIPAEDPVTRARRRAFLLNTLADMLSRQGRCQALEDAASSFSTNSDVRDRGQVVRFSTGVLRCFDAARDRRGVRQAAANLLGVLREDVAARAAEGQMFHLGASTVHYRLASSAILDAYSALRMTRREEDRETVFAAAQMSHFNATTWTLAFLRRLREDPRPEEQERLRSVLRAEAVFSRFVATSAAAPGELRRNRPSEAEYMEIINDWTQHAGAANNAPTLAMVELLPSLSDVQQRLKSTDAAIMTFVERDTVWLLLLRSDSMSLAASPTPASAVLADVREVRRHLDDGGADLTFDFAAANRLYAALIAPLTSDLAGVSHVVWCPDPAISSLPPAVMVTSAFEGEGHAALSNAPWAARRYTFTTITAPLALMFSEPQRPEAEPSYLGIGDPVIAMTAAPPRAPEQGWRGNIALADIEALPELPETAEEVETIAGMFGERSTVLLSHEATERDVRALDLSAYRIVHFATHGLNGGDIVDLDEPALVLSSPPALGEAANDGLLTASEIALLRLDADWVILSACNTAAPGFEAMLYETAPFSGYARAFFLAGARNLLVSHWPVDSQSATRMTIIMLQRWHDTGDRAEALKAAMEEVMSDAEHPEWAHPRYWAPYALVATGAR